MTDFVKAIATAAKSGGTVTATVNGQSTTVNAPRDLTIAAGDVLAVAKLGAEWYVINRYLTAAITVDPGNSVPVNPNPTASGALAVNPVETRSYRNGSWRTDNTSVYQGQFGGQGNHTGVAFYGNAPRSLAGATVTSATVRVTRKNGGGITAAQATTMRLVTQATRPGGAPTLGASTAGPSLAWGQTATAFAIPTSWAQQMVDGTAGGLGFFVSGGSPYVILSGLGEASGAFSMTIRWRR